AQPSPPYRGPPQGGRARPVRSGPPTSPGGPAARTPPTSRQPLTGNTLAAGAMSAFAHMPVSMATPTLYSAVTWVWGGGSCRSRREDFLGGCCRGGMTDPPIERHRILACLDASADLVAHRDTARREHREDSRDLGLDLAPDLALVLALPV